MTPTGLISNRSWWRALVGSVTLRRFHAIKTWLWAAQIPMVLWVFPEWQKSLPYLIFISLAASLEGSLGAWQTTREAQGVIETVTETMPSQTDS